MSNHGWPAWFRGPGGQKQIFHRVEDVPPGWYSGHENRHLIREPEAPPPEDGEDAWGGVPKGELVQMLRQAGEKIRANTSARKMHEKAVELGLLAAMAVVVEDNTPAVEDNTPVVEDNTAAFEANIPEVGGDGLG